DTPVFTVGQLQVDLARRYVSVAEQPVHLAPIEYKLLATLVHYAGKVVTHRQLLQEVWGEHARHDAHYLWVYMSQLRHKLEPEQARHTRAPLSWGVQQPPAPQTRAGAGSPTLSAYGVRCRIPPQGG